MLNDYPLRKLNTWGVGGCCSKFLAPESSAEAALYIARAFESGEKVYILGGGSNVLISDRKLEGLLIHTAGLCCFNIHRDLGSDATEIEIGGGVDVKKLLAFAIKNRLGGSEFLTGIPGTVGGAMWGNAGASGEGFAPYVKSTETIEKDGSFKLRRGDELSWLYRTSPWKDTESILMTKCTIVLKDSGFENILSRIAHFSQLKKGQPLGKKTAGCVFKNPPGASAGKLLDQSGCKELRVGDAVVSPHHANFIENSGSATADDIYKLCELCRKRVRAYFGTELEYEVRMFGDFEEKN